ncbi:DUF1707 SHOCT-like domain-containing protein [Nocardia rhizosphaerihabitans]|uniref:DUF1707 domain-containing protein n=1 Tax=Nocardia rhizosphaerihabitans TaxID=1691570 RepID=A0ABQ2K8F5_9NOCA|nr:DUF1707 domain-containing protein [Nocardia rhizosphaerihabitans]GGN71324.1 hypothetical protein GCM10011610_11400 [Nocardia rhizosphaerihabitans]
MDITPGTRASDAERNAIVAQLGTHLADGRLDLAEYDQRVAKVYATTTRDELAVVLSDLPPLTKQATAPAERKPGKRIPVWQRIEAGSWLGVSVIVLVIWGLISLTAGELTYFWPMWVIGPWGAVLVFRVITGWEATPGTQTHLRQLQKQMKHVQHMDPHNPDRPH